MADEMTLREAAGTSPEAAEALAMADAFRDALIGGDFDWNGPDGISTAITAASIFAGMLFGQLIAIGAARDGDRRRAADGIVRNFRTGTDLGKRNALRVIREQGGEVLQ